MYVFALQGCSVLLPASSFSQRDPSPDRFPVEIAQMCISKFSVPRDRFVQEPSSSLSISARSNQLFSSTLPANSMGRTVFIPTEANRARTDYVIDFGAQSVLDVLVDLKSV